MAFIGTFMVIALGYVVMKGFTGAFRHALEQRALGNNKPIRKVILYGIGATICVAWAIFEGLIVG